MVKILIIYIKVIIIVSFIFIYYKSNVILCEYDLMSHINKILVEDLKEIVSRKDFKLALKYIKVTDDMIIEFIKENENFIKNIWEKTNNISVVKQFIREKYIEELRVQDFECYKNYLKSKIYYAISFIITSFEVSSNFLWHYRQAYQNTFFYAYHMMRGHFGVYVKSNLYTFLRKCLINGLVFISFLPHLIPHIDNFYSYTTPDDVIEFIKYLHTIAINTFVPLNYNNFDNIISKDLFNNIKSFFIPKLKHISIKSVESTTADIIDFNDDYF